MRYDQLAVLARRTRNDVIRERAQHLPCLPNAANGTPADA